MFGQVLAAAIALALFAAVVLVLLGAGLAALALKYRPWPPPRCPHCKAILAAVCTDREGCLARAEGLGFESWRIG